MKVITTSALPDVLDAHTIYHLPAEYDDPVYYDERTNRNIGWLSAEEQQRLKSACVGLASVGGIGGAVSQMLLRSGITKLKLADLEPFDTSNINRQFGATRGTIGCSRSLRLCKSNVIPNSEDNRTPMHRHVPTLH